jgi:hypothetical protein
VNQTVTQGGAAFIVVNTDGTTTNFAIRPDGSITLNANGIATLKTQLGIP